MQVKMVTTEERKCGRRKEHGAYIVSPEISDVGILSPLVWLNPPVPYPVKLHRTPRIVDANAILSREPMEKWWFGSSKEAEQKKSADQWALDTFGMTVTRRLQIGECAGATTPEEALADLVVKVTWSNKVLRWFKELTIDKIQELQRVAPEYNRLHESIAAYQMTNQVGHLMEIAAAVWRMAYLLPPTKRPLYIPNLVRIISLLGLRKDAIAMQKTFLG